MKLYSVEVAMLPLTALLRYIRNPFGQPIWNGAGRCLSKENVGVFLKNKDFVQAVHDPFVKFPMFWHERRVAYFVDQLQCGNEVDPICLEMPIPSLNYYPTEMMTDGYHRIAAHIYTEADLIQVSVGGGTFEFLQLVRRSCEPDFVAAFEKDFFEVHVDMCPETGTVNSYGKSRMPNPVGAAIEEMMDVMQDPKASLSDYINAAIKGDSNGL